jgi:preprotein translocase subunit SecG
MTAFFVVLHILVCFVLILFVLLQPGARGGVGSAFGGAGGATVFGGRGANTFLAKLTAAAAVIFMLTSIGLSYVASHGSSVMKSRATATVPAKADEKKADDVKPEAAKADAPADAPKAAADAPAAPAADAPAAPAADAPVAPAAPAKNNEAP